MHYRKSIHWPVNVPGEGTVDGRGENTIDVAFVFESAHGDPYAGHDADGTVQTVRLVEPALAERLLGAQLAYPNPGRDAVYADIYAAAERQLVGRVAGTPLPLFTPDPDLPSIEQLEVEAKEAEAKVAAAEARRQALRDASKSA